MLTHLRESSAAADTHSFLSGGGEMGALMRSFDWAKTSLGPPSRWPQSLRTVVRLLLNTGHPMYIWWGADLLCFYNDAYRRCIGPERHPGSLGMPARAVWAEIWPIIGPQIEQVMSGRGATWHENHLVPITRNGRTEDVYWTYSYSPIDDETVPNGIGGVLVVCSETTQQVIAAQQLEGERDWFAQLFEQAPTFMAVLRGPNHRFEIANPGYLEVVGRQSVVGKTLAEALPEAVAQGYLTLLDAVFNSGKAYSAVGAKFSIQATPGDVMIDRYVDFVYQPIKNAEGAVTGIFVVGADVTARAMAEAERQALLEREQHARASADDANRTKDEFLAMLGHELRNPLAPIVSALYLMRLRGKDLMVVERQIIERQVAHMTRLVDDLLDVSRIATGRIEIKKDHVDLESVVTAAAEAVAPLIEERRHKLTLDMSEAAVIGDEARLTQVVSNLLTNAARYTPEGGALRLVLHRMGKDVVLEVSDSGQGIAADILPRIFDLFVQGKQSSERSKGGLGLGLAIVRSLVQLHAGTITAHSDGVGMGATFVVRMPGAPPKRTRGAGGGWDELVTTGDGDSNLQILLVDDNKDAASILADCLRQIGYKVLVAHDGMAALELAAAAGPDAVILDIGLPGMDGYEVAARLRKLKGLSATPIIAVTGYGQDRDRNDSKHAGINCHLVKPVEPAMLVMMIQRYLGKSKSA